MSENIAEKIKELEVMISRLASDASSIESQIDEADTSYVIGEAKNAVETLTGELNDLESALEEIRESVEVENPHSEIEEYRIASSRTIADVVVMLSTGIDRLSKFQHRQLNATQYQNSVDSLSDLKKQRYAISNIYWMLVDLFGYSDEQFLGNLLDKKLDYTFQPVEKEASVNA